MIKYYNDILCIEASWMTGIAGILSKTNYDVLKRRGKLTQFRKGGNGRTALVEYASIPERFKNKIIDKIGNPEEQAKHQQFRKHLKPSRKAIEYFGNYKIPNGNYLPTDRAKEYTTNAMFLNAVNIVSQYSKAKRKAMGGKRTCVWQAVSDVVNELQKEYQHTLPANYLRLKEKTKQFNSQGFESLIHKSVIPNS